MLYELRTYSMKAGSLGRDGQGSEYLTLARDIRKNDYGKIRAAAFAVENNQAGPVGPSCLFKA
jgi:hypothetical protein